MDVLGGGVEGNPWRMPKMSWSAAEFGDGEETCSRKLMFGWR